MKPTPHNPSLELYRDIAMRTIVAQPQPLPSGRVVAPRPPHRGELWQKETVTARLARGANPARGGFEITTCIKCAIERMKKVVGAMLLSKYDYQNMIMQRAYKTYEGRL